MMITEIIVLLFFILAIIWVISKPWLRHKDKKVCGLHGELDSHFLFCPACGKPPRVKRKHPLIFVVKSNIDKFNKTYK